MEGNITLSTPLTDCEIGVPKELTVMVTPTANDEQSGFVGEVSEVIGYEHEGEKPQPGYESKGMKGSAPAVVIAIGKTKARK